MRRRKEGKTTIIEMDKEDGVTPIPEGRVVPADSYMVSPWSPNKDHVGGPTQVHLVLPLDPIREGMLVAMRLKSRDAVNRLIQTLASARDKVWIPDA